MRKAKRGKRKVKKPRISIEFAAAILCIALGHRAHACPCADCRARMTPVRSSTREEPRHV